jgi:hypothetical protein
MKPIVRALVDVYLASHFGVIGRSRALDLGMTADEVEWRLRTDAWKRLYRGVYLVASQPAGPEARLTAACLAAGELAAASHRSAAWLWGLLPEPPATPSVTVMSSRRMRVTGIETHRRPDLDLSRVLVHRGISVTDPLRALVDLAEVADDRELDDAIDRAIARRLLTVGAIDAEIVRLGRKGRRGVRPLRAALRRRGLVEGPSPSVLESRVLRILHRGGIAPLGAEVVVCDGRYRVDVLLRPGLVLEVDGYAFHWSPEAKAADSHRRNQLALSGLQVVEADWVTVMRDPKRFRLTVEEAVCQHDATIPAPAEGGGPYRPGPCRTGSEGRAPAEGGPPAANPTEGNSRRGTSLAAS